MIRRIRHSWPILLVGLAGIMIAVAMTTYMLVQVGHGAIYHELSAVPDSAGRVAVVFGAALRAGQPSDVLSDRILSAVDLYRAGKVEKLLLSGDNRFIDYNEPVAMQELALKNGVDAEDIVLDYAGRRTHDTCYRAAHIFEVKNAILVTNAFHLPRAMFICRAAGLDASGYAADRREYEKILTWRLRELPASIVAWFESSVFKPEAEIMGDVEPITVESN